MLLRVRVISARDTWPIFRKLALFLKDTIQDHKTPICFQSFYSVIISRIKVYQFLLNETVEIRCKINNVFGYVALKIFLIVI